MRLGARGLASGRGGRLWRRLRVEELVELIEISLRLLRREAAGCQLLRLGPVLARAVVVGLHRVESAALQIGVSEIGIDGDRAIDVVEREIDGVARINMA